MHSSDFNDIETEESGNTISFKELFSLFLSKWYLFLMSVVITLCGAYIYLKITPPVFTRSAEILIKDDNNGGSISGMGASTELANLGLVSSNTNVGNEIRTLKSLSLSSEVVTALKLDINYYANTPWRKEVLYGASNPIEVVYNESLDFVESGFNVTLLDDGTIKLWDFEWDDDGLEFDSDEIFVGGFGDEFVTPVGKIIINKSPFYDAVLFEDVIAVTRSSVYNIAKGFVDRLMVELSGKEATTIILTLDDQSPQRADDYISTLISVYNDNWIKDKNQIASSTDKFISERLVAIALSLGDVDEDISSFKSENMMPDIDLATSMYMQESSKLDAEIMELNNQISMAKYIRDYLTADANTNMLLPANSGVESANIESQIASYNSIQLQRNRVVVNSSATNPIVVNFDKELAAMRAAIITSIDNQIVTLQTRMASISKRDRQASQRIVDNPKQAKELLSVSRQQKVMEAIYLYLLQKREENQLTQAFTAYNTRIINLPNGSSSPTSPNKMMIMLIALMIGLALPAMGIYLAESMVTVVRGRRDLDGLKITFLGEIPQVGANKICYSGQIFETIGLKKRQEDGGYLVVKIKSRNLINEAFRIVRTNIEFMLKREVGAKVIMTTSLNPNSGKTFVTLNLAASFAIKGSKVLIIDLDIRKATISKVLSNNTQGITSYLNYSVDDLSSLIECGGYFPNVGADNSTESKSKGQFYPTLDVLPVGTIPPNPTELLVDIRLSEAFEQLRKEYDYIFVDCPPSEIVADVSIINDFVDMTLYIARVGHIERSLLKEIDRFYNEKKYKNISMILNGSGTIGGNYGYGYGYGYGSINDGYTVED